MASSSTASYMYSYCFTLLCLVFLGSPYKTVAYVIPTCRTVKSSLTQRSASRRDVLVSTGTTTLLSVVTAAFPSLANANGETGFTQDSRGFSYKIMTPGSSEGITARGQKATVSYTLSLDGFVDGSSKPAGRTIESSVGLLGDNPISFPVGVGQVIKGWDYNVRDMKVGERRVVIIPSELGYGKASMGGGLNAKIEPYSTLYFDITLKSVGQVPVLNDAQKKWLEEHPE